MPRSIEDIIPPSRRRMMQGDEAPQQPQPVPETAPVTPIGPTPPPTPPPFVPSPSSDLPPMSPQRVKIKVGRSFPYGTAIIAIIVIAASAFALYAFSGAKVEITPESQPVTVTGSFTANAGSGNTLPFQVVTVTKTASASVPAESTETVNDSAQGTIVVSNAQNKPESLITNTRFQTPSGLIFRVHQAINIPAATSNGPGTLSVTVYADQPGQQYNVAPTTFTVPGLQGSDAYAQVTAKSSSSMMGGFAGTRAAVSQSTDTTKQAQLQQTLATNLQQALTGQIPAGDVLISGANTTSYQALPDTATTTSSVVITEQGTMTAVVLPQDALAQSIAYKAVGTYSGEPVTLSDISGLTMSSLTAISSSTMASSTDIANASSISFNLQGNTMVVWKVDTSKIAGAVAGKTRDSAQQILSGFPEVDRAVLVLRPFWASTFPSDPSHIKVTVSTPTTGQ